MCVFTGMPLFGVAIVPQNSEGGISVHRLRTFRTVDTLPCKN